MTDSIDREQAVVQAIGELPRELPPRRDLWPDIQARLGEQAAPAAPVSGAWRWRAVAASVIVAFAAGLMLGRQAEGPSTPGPAVTDSLQQVAMQAALQASEREYQAAFQAFTPVGVDTDYLRAGTVQGLEHSWEDLLEAEAALMAALEAHPDNAFLSEKLLNLRAQQLEFMRQIHMLDQNSRRKT